MKKCINGEMVELTPQEIAEIKKDQQEYEQSAEYKLAQIQSLKDELATYDYIGVKIATDVATIEEYADKIAYCESLRDKIRELESEVVE